MKRTAKKVDKDSPSRGKMVAIYIPAEVHEQAQQMKALGIIPSISSLWMEGFQARKVRCSREAREREVRELRERADRLASFYANMEIEETKNSAVREDILNEYRDRIAKNPYIRSNYRSAQMTWLSSRMDRISEAFPDIQSVEEAYTIIESLVAVKK